jgi:hypothetical protein
MGGSKIVYSSINIDGIAPAKLFVLDVQTKTIEREIVPMPDRSALDKIVEVEPGVVFGINGDKCYKVDIRTGDVIYVKDLGGTAFPNMSSYNRRVTLGPDGCVWLYIDDWISRIRPSDGVVEKIVQTKPIGGLTFLNGELYIWGSASVRRITGLF